MNRDSFIKESVFKLFWSWNYVPFYEINLYHNIGISTEKKQVTDIDVLGIKLTQSFQIEKIISECKSGKDSPIKIILWLKGLMDYFQANNGLVVTGKTIPEEHKLIANSLSVRVFNISELNKFLKCYNFSVFDDFNFYKYDIYKDFVKKVFSNKNFLTTKEVIYYKFWIWDDTKKLRSLLGEIKKISNNLNENSKYHQAFVAELIGLVSIALQIMVSYFFPIYLSPNTKTMLDHYLKNWRCHKVA